jgi:hypothetical protein
VFSLVDSCVALPGACYLCGSGEKAPFIDWGVSIEFYGALYTCKECTASVASLLGMKTQEQHSTLIQHLDQLNAENVDLQIKNYALKQVIDAMKIVGIDEPVPNTDDLPSDTFADPVLELLADDPPVVETTREADELLDFGEGTSDESSDDEGMDKLRSTSSKSDRKFSI